VTLPRPQAVLLIISLACSGAPATWAQAGAASPPDSVLLRVDGEVARPLSLTAADFAALPRRTVQGGLHGDPPADFEGVALEDLLRRAGAPLGSALRGDGLALYVVVTAADGYRVVFALAELDPGFTDRVVLLADRHAGRPLPADEGPLRVVVPGEKRGARWARQVVRLTVQRAPS